MRAAVNVAGQAADEMGMEAQAAIREIARTATLEIQRLQVQVQRNLAVIQQRQRTERRERLGRSA